MKQIYAKIAMAAIGSYAIYLGITTHCAPPVTENLESLTSAINDLKKASKTITDIPGEIEDGLKQVVAPIETFFDNVFQTPIQDILAFTRQITAYLDALPAQLQRIGGDVEGIGTNIGQEFVNLGTGIGTGLNDIFTFIGLFKYIGAYLKVFFTTYISSRVDCGIKKITNFRSCFIYYALDLVGYTLYYILVEFPVWLIRAMSGYDLQPWIDAAFDKLGELNDIVFNLTGVNITKYPSYVTDDCYACQNLQDLPEFPTQLFQDQIQTINYDWNVAIPASLVGPAENIRKYGADLVQ